jgi:hypothetical protein
MSYKAAKSQDIGFPEIIAAAAVSLREYLPSTFSLTLGSEKSDDAWRRQWQPVSKRKPPNGGWDWPACRSSRSKDPTCFCAAMWCRNGSELCSLLLLRLNKTACRIEMVEGSPNSQHSMRGLVIPVALELAAMYAQAQGRREVWLCSPANDMLLWFLINDYGFELASPKNGNPFCRREV